MFIMLIEAMKAFVIFLFVMAFLGFLYNVFIYVRLSHGKESGYRKVAGNS